MRWFLIVVACAGCGSATAPQIAWTPQGEAFDPPDVYTAWWDDVTACVGVSGNFDAIQWFAVPGVSFDTPDYGMASGRWVAPHDIYIAEAHLLHRGIVKHEMVHELLRPGDTSDPRFLDCSGVTHG